MMKIYPFYLIPQQGITGMTNVNKCYIIMYFIHGMYKELNIIIILMMKGNWKDPSNYYLLCKDNK